MLLDCVMKVTFVLVIKGLVYSVCYDELSQRNY